VPVSQSVDVLILGGGAAGLAAALSAMEAGVSVLIATKARLGDGSSAEETDGIPAAVAKDDSPSAHFLDLAAAGRFSGSRPHRAVLAETSPALIRWLVGLGVPFDREADGSFRLGGDGISVQPRMLRAGEVTGRAVLQVLRDAFLARGGQLRECSAAVELCSTREGASGALLEDQETGERTTIQSLTVLVATGRSVNDGIALGYRAGAAVTGIEERHFHPWTAAFPSGLAGTPIPDSIAEAGAIPLSPDGRPLADPLEQDDALNASLWDACADAEASLALPNGQRAVWLDLPAYEAMHPGALARGFPALARSLRRQGIEPTMHAIPVAPDHRYDLGGLSADVDGATLVSGLFAAGQVVGGIHGHSVAPGTALLASLLFGRRAGAAAARKALLSAPLFPGFEHLRHWEGERLTRIRSTG